jgi:hypothetical protein
MNAVRVSTPGAEKISGLFAINLPYPNPFQVASRTATAATQGQYMQQLDYDD